MPNVEETLAGMTHLTDEQKNKIRKAVAKEGKPGRRVTEAQLREKNRVFIEGTLAWDDVAKKQFVEIECTHEGCDQRRKVFTSDLFQVKVCLEHRNDARKAKKAQDKADFDAFKAAQAKGSEE
jgi:hypothetical protein